MVLKITIYNFLKMVSGSQVFSPASIPVPSGHLLLFTILMGVCVCVGGGNRIILGYDELCKN